MSTAGLEQQVIDEGFKFAGTKVDAGVPPLGEELFNVTDTARLYTKVHADLGMIADPDRAGEIILNGMKNLHVTLMADRLPGDARILPFWAVDLADREGAFEEGEAAFNNQVPGQSELSIYRPLYSQLSVEQLNRRSFAGEAAVKGWGARAMLLGGEREDAPGLLLTGLSATEQIKAYKELRAAYDAAHPNSALALLNVFDHLVIDAAIRETNEANGETKPLLDPNTFSRTPQASDDPETGLVEASVGVSWVPVVDSLGDLVYLGRSHGDATSHEGLRASTGQRQKAA